MEEEMKYLSPKNRWFAFLILIAVLSLLSGILLYSGWNSIASADVASLGSRLSRLTMQGDMAGLNRGLSGTGPRNPGNRPIKKSTGISVPTIQPSSNIATSIQASIAKRIAPQRYSKGKSLITDSQHKNLNSLVASTQGTGGVNVKFDIGNGTPILIKGKTITPALNRNATDLAKTRSVAEKFLSTNRDLLKLDDPSAELVGKKEEIDHLGNKHFRYQQTMNGIPLWGKELMVHLDARDSIYFLQGKIEPTPRGLDPMPGITARKAIEITKEHLVESTDGIVPPESALVYYKSASGDYILAYKVDISPRLDQRWIYFVDARKKNVVHRIYNIHNDVQTATGADLNSTSRSFNVWFENAKYYLIDPSTPLADPSYPNPISKPNELGDTYIFSANNGDGSTLYLNTSSSINSGWDAAGVSAAYNTRKVYDYYLNTHTRHSIDGKNKNLMAVTHFESQYNNAFWQGTFMVYGDGDNIKFKSLAGGLDVAAHEMTHGVIQSTANLIYENQSGALNESFADVFAAMVDRNNWTIGEDVTVSSPGFLRSMSDPSKGLRPQPVKMSQYQNLSNDKDHDNGGVHVNSGIPNRAAYLTAEGLTAEGLGASIGREKTEKIYYRALTTYLQSSSQFLDARHALIQSAEDLFGVNQAEVNAVKAAWDAVEVTDGNVGSPGDQNPSPTDPVSGDDLMVYLYPVDRSHDKPYDPSELYKLYVQSIPSPFTGYDPSKDIGPLNGSVSPRYTRPVAYSADNSTVIFYVGLDYNIYAVYRDGTGLTQITSSGNAWSIALSPDGHYFAFTTTQSNDPNIYVVDLIDNNNLILPVTPPGDTPSGTNTKSVLYADALSFDYTGKRIAFDALNCLSLEGSLCSDGKGYRYWSLGFLDITAKQITYPIPDQNPLFDIENPSFAKNNSYVIAVDLLDYTPYADNNIIVSRVYTLDFSKQNMAIVANPNLGSNDRAVSGSPSFWGDDKFITIQQLTDSGGLAYRIPIDTSWVGDPTKKMKLNDYDVAMPVMHRAGERTSTGTIQSTPTLLDFGDVNLGESSEKSVTISNTGNRDVNITNLAITGSTAFTHNGTNALLPRGKQMIIKVTFSPANTAGTQSSTLNITSDGEPSLLAISQTGTGIAVNPTPPPPSGGGSSGGGGGGGCSIGGEAKTAEDAIGSYGFWLFALCLWIGYRSLRRRNVR